MVRSMARTSNPLANPDRLHLALIKIQVSYASVTPIVVAYVTVITIIVLPSQQVLPTDY